MNIKIPVLKINDQWSMIDKNMEEEIKKLVQRNLQMTEEIFKTTKYIKRYIVWSQIMGYVKLVLIIGPIIIGYIYLLPFLKTALEQYGQVLGVNQSLYGNLLNTIKQNKPQIEAPATENKPSTNRLEDLMK